MFIYALFNNLSKFTPKSPFRTIAPPHRSPYLTLNFPAMHKPLALSLALLISWSTTALAQKETYDVVSYTAPGGWKKDIKENGIQLYTGDEKTGEYSVVIIIKSTETTASASENFTNLWQKLIKGTVTVTNDPTPSEPAPSSPLPAMARWPP